MNPFEMITKEKKLLSHVRVVILNITIILLFVGCKNQGIESIDVYSLDWFMTTQGNLASKQVKDWRGDELHRYKVTEQGLLSSIQDRIKNLQPFSDIDHIDVRMVCILHYRDGKNEELKMAGGTQLIEYRGKIFKKDSILMGLIEEQLRISHIPIVRIERVLNVDDNHFTYRIIITHGVADIKTKEDLIKALNGTVPEKNGIINAKQISPTEWEIDTGRSSPTDNVQ